MYSMQKNSYWNSKSQNNWCFSMISFVYFVICLETDIDSPFIFSFDVFSGGEIRFPDFPAEYFDRILLDVPCSALGQRPSVKNPMTLNSLKSYPGYQRKFIRKVWLHSLKRMVMSVVVKSYVFLESYPGYQMEFIRKVWLHSLKSMVMSVWLTNPSYPEYQKKFIRKVCLISLKS